MQRAAASKSTWLAVAAFYVAVTLAYGWPLLPALGSRLPSDVGDPGLNTWILWWNAHAMPLTTRWWDAPAFFPVRGVFALSETLLGLAPLTTPLQWMGASAVVAYNIAYLLSFFSAAFAAHALAHRLTGRHSAALLAGLAFGFSPYRAAQMPHVQTLVSCWMPLALLALHRFLDHRRTRDLALFGVAWLLNGLTTGYFLFFFAVLLGCWLLWFVRTRRDAIAIGAALVMASLPLAPWLVGYTQHQATFGISRGLGEIVFFSADLSAIWAASPFVWLASHWTFAPRPEGELYPGAVVLALVLAGVVAAIAGRARLGPPFPAERPGLRLTRLTLFGLGVIVATIAFVSWTSGGWTLSLGGLPLSTTHPFKTVTSAVWLFTFSALLHPRLWDGWRRRSTLLFYALAAFVMLVLALGPLGHVMGARFLYQAPYSWLMALPGGHSLRVPARFATPLILCLTQAAALGLMRLTRGRPATGLVAALAVAIALDGWVPKLKTDPIPMRVDLSGLDPGAAVIELPMQDLYSDTVAMVRATQHGRPLVNGYSGYIPTPYIFVQRGMQDHDAATFGVLQESSPLLILINRDKDDGGRTVEFVKGVPGTTLVRDTPVGAVYALPARAPAQTTSAGAAVAIRSTHATDKDTRITFDQPRAVTRLEIVLAGDPLGYPRRLRVSAPRAPGADPEVVWEGGTAAPALRGALRNAAHVVLVIDLPAAMPATEYLLTFEGDDPKARWTVAEIAAFGR